MTNWMIDTMVSMTLLMALVLIIRKPVSHFFGAHIAYLLWALPLARLFMPTLTLKAPAPELVDASVAGAVPGLLTTDIAGSAVAEQVAMSTFASIDWMMIAMVVWLGGAGMLFISKLAAYFQFREDIVSDGRLVGRHGRIKILETAAVGGPLAFGLFEKYIAVPTNFFRDYAPRERELALEHEIAHHESGDLAANFIGLLVLSLHWFNPVAWYAWIAFRQDQETACDARILQNGGRDLRAVYGRTIAKSASGHKLGLASPLNQKNKIKSRLKMLGQKEKSKVRKSVGALMVGASTVIALPLTATVTYAVETETHPHEDGVVMDDFDDGRQNQGVKIRTKSSSVDVGRNGVVVAEKSADGYKYHVENDKGSFQFKSKHKLKESEIAQRLRKLGATRQDMDTSWTPVAPVPPVPPVAPVPPADLEFVAKDKSSGTINITMLNGEKDWAKVRASGNEHVHKIKHNGRTVVLRTNKKLSKAEIRELVEEAEESRLEAEESLREAKLDREEMRRELAEAERELKEAEREWKREWREERKEAARTDREAKREIEQALREAQRDVREAKREAARAMREVEREAREAEREAIEAAREAREVVEAKTVAARIWDISQIAFKPNFRSAVSSSSRSKSESRSSRARSASNSNADCVAMNKEIAFAGQGAMNDRAWASVVGCVGKDERAVLKVTLKALERKRAKAAECSSKDSREKLKIYDHDIKQLKAQLSIT